MCGINGIFSKNSIPQIETRIIKMNASIEHRGPDASGKYIINKNIALGHQRLSILDLDARSNQPMNSFSNRYTIVFNGEIFNFHELRNKIKYPFKTTSDTEVILASIELNGIDWFLERANGMFAFALYDDITKEIILFRDRFGIKPLFYTVFEDTLIFSSEIKGILNSGLIEPEFNERAIDEYLANRYVREPFTLFKNIFQVNSSTYKIFDSNLNISEVKYWNLPRLNFNNEYNEKEIISETKNKVREAINRWLIADVKVGAYLSGGLDSSLTTAIIAQDSSNKVDTYTIGFKEDGFNEFEYARKVAHKYDTKHREFIVTEKEFNKEWDRLIEFKDAPLAVPNEIPLAIMSTNLSSDITVVISGEGADELFGGYGKIFRSAFDFKNTKNKISFYQYFINKYDYVNRELRNKYLISNNNYRSHFDSMIESDFKLYQNEENIFRFFHEFHIKGLLNRVDMTTMQTSVEARPPFLDHELIEYVYQNVPYDLKLKWKSEEAKKEASNLSSNIYSEENDIPKYILKKLSEDLLPYEVIYRKKMGFPVPLTKWFPNLAELSRELLTNTDWLNQSVIEELLEELQNNQRAGQLLWMFLNIELFKRKYFSKNWKW